MKNCGVTNNWAVGNGGCIYNNAGVIRAESSQFEGNAAGYECGGIYNSLGTVTLNDCRIIRNTVQYTPSFGGALRNDEGFLALTNCLVSSNSAVHGGGVCNYSGSSVTIVRRSLFENNSARHGGGIQLNAGTLDIAETTFLGNSASLNGGAVDADGRLIIVGCTFSSNSAAFDGGGIRNNFRRLNVSHSTFSGNSAGGQGGAICNVGTSTMLIGHTLLAGGFSGSNVFNEGGVITNAGFNLSDDQSCAGFFGPSDIVTADAKLGPLRSNGAGPQPMPFSRTAPPSMRVPTVPSRPLSSTSVVRCFYASSANESTSGRSKFSRRHHYASLPGRRSAPGALRFALAGRTAFLTALKDRRVWIDGRISVRLPSSVPSQFEYLDMEASWQPKFYRVTFQ